MRYIFQCKLLCVTTVMFILVRHLKNSAIRCKIISKSKNHCIIIMRDKQFIACLSDIQQLENSICGMSYFIDIIDLTRYYKKKGYI